MIVLDGKTIGDAISIQRKHAGVTQERSLSTSKVKAESMRLALNRDGVYSIIVIRVEEEVDERSFGNNRGYTLARNRISVDGVHSTKVVQVEKVDDNIVQRRRMRAEWRRLARNCIVGDGLNMRRLERGRGKRQLAQSQNRSRTGAEVGQHRVYDCH